MSGTDTTSAVPAATVDGLPTAHLPGERPLVVVTVGSDHHRFDRLIGWVEEWLASGAADRVDCVVQYGTATPPRHGLAVAFLAHAELQRLIGAATVVISQGGPMSIVESRRLGRVPVVIPRTAALDEVVDDHQHAFCRRLAEQGLIRLVDSPATLAEAVEEGLAEPVSLTVTPDPGYDAAIAAAVERFGRTADAVARRTPGRGPTVLMLGGFGRSGSTLLERMLGQVPGVTALGETVHLWERGLRDHERCGCGAQFDECAFWSEVGRHAFGGWSEVEPADAVTDRKDVVRNRNLPALVSFFPDTTRRLRRNRLLRRMDALYGTAVEIDGARLLVDSSKHPAYAFLARRASVRLRCVISVRDPRGVAYSWAKTVVRPEVTSGTKEMPRYGVLASALRWSLYNLLFHALQALRVPVHVVRYEDLVARPREVLTQVLEFAGIQPSEADLAHVKDGVVTLDPHHTVAGNPMRFQVGEVSLRLDEEWRRSMPARQRRVVELVTAPLRRAYGYRD